MNIYLKVISFVLVSVFGVINFLCLLKLLGIVINNWIDYIWFITGVLIWYVIKRFFSSNVAFFQTFTHEFVHVIVSLVFFHRIHSFNATENDGGYFTHSGRFLNNPFIGLSPYFFPIYSIFLLSIRLAVTSDLIWLFNFFTGIVTCFHFFAIKNDIHPGQTDITKLGILYSYVFIWSFIFFFTLIVLKGVQTDLLNAFHYWWNNFGAWIEFIFDFLSGCF